MTSISEIAHGEITPFAGTVAAENLRDEIVMVAHDLRNPLACVVSSLELLGAKAEDGMKGDINSIVGRGLRAAERLDGMLQGLLDRARLQREAPPRRPSICSLRLIVEAAVEHNLPRAERKSISILVTGSDVLAETDEFQLIEAIDNLINNAVKYSHRGTEITCDVGQDVSSAFIRITDQGSGLTHNDLKYMGRPYQKLSATPTGGERSTGIGLWSTRRIAKALGGDLCATSDGPNKGATFTLRLRDPADQPNWSDMQQTKSLEGIRS